MYQYIDIEKAKEVFKEYIKDYDLHDSQINLKINHILRTSKVSKEIAERLNLSKEDIELAELIGLLHDIGRFEQVKRYHTFIDKKSINHGEFGVKLLFEDGLIRKFIEKNDYDNIIKKAILNHNKSNIEEGLNEKELLHSKIIRDSDKLDIFYILTFDDYKNIYGVEDISNQNITDSIYKEFMNNKMVNYLDMETEADLVVAHLAYVYNLYYKCSIEVLIKNNYIEKIYKRNNFLNKESNKKYEEVYKCVKEYLEEKIK